MKKFTVLLVTTVLALTFVFAACSTTEKTDTMFRWPDSDTSTYVFDIELSDFSGQSTPLFTSYAQQNGTYYKDFAMSAAVEHPDNKDEIKPVTAKGTYTMSISSVDAGSSCLFETTQVLYATYDRFELQELEGWSELDKIDLAYDSEEIPFNANENQVVLKTETTSSVKFEKKSAQRPIESSTVVKGFYVGKKHQAVSEYSVLTQYDFDNSTATVTINGGEPQVNTLNITSGKNFIDANQLLLYIRTLEKGSTKFQDSPTVVVYTPYTNATYTASFSFSYTANIALEIGEGEDSVWHYVGLNSVSVLLDGTPYLNQLNLPDTLTEKGLDCSGSTPNYTTVSFRSGYFSYRWRDIPSDVLSALKGSEE